MIVFSISVKNVTGILKWIELTFLLLFIFIIINLLTCTYIVWVIAPPRSPPPPFLPFPPQFQTGPVLPLSLVFLKKRDKHNKEEKVFLLVKLRIAIQKYS
jgi:hypothetical protein